MRRLVRAVRRGSTGQKNIAKPRLVRLAAGKRVTIADGKAPQQKGIVKSCNGKSVVVAVKQPFVLEQGGKQKQVSKTVFLKVPPRNVRQRPQAQA